MSTERTLADRAVAEDVRRLTQARPLTHCITNIVVTGFTANVLLAIGASPAMVVAEEEAGDFAAAAAALLVNVGTVTPQDLGGMRAAARGAHAAGTPWVLDPVAVGVLGYRTEVVGELLGHAPTAIRGNASEILALAGESAGGKGVDSTAQSAAALGAARALAKRTGSVVAVSGIVDYVTDGAEVVAVPGGHELMGEVTGTGCALGAVIAAFLAVAPTPLDGAVAASALFAAAGERAGHESRGPGSFAGAFIDQLHLLSKGAPAAS
ncbi:MAG: hydroxyethylthiazole kinase [Solirubrobacteraceae bacterium]|jgi:hydroxyethylthiazole kinase